MLCPACEGKKEIIGLFPIKIDDDNSSECSNHPPIEVFPCFYCNGTGRVDDKTSQWIITGQEFRNARWQSGLSLRDASKKLEIDICLLADMEIGKVKPNPDLLTKYLSFS